MIEADRGVIRCMSECVRGVRVGRRPVMVLPRKYVTLKYVIEEYRG